MWDALKRRRPPNQRNDRVAANNEHEETMNEAELMVAPGKPGSKRTLDYTREIHLSEAQASRFWSKVVKSDGCWRYTGKKRPKGYGTFLASGVDYLAHRVAFTLSTGQQIPNGYVCCHRCDQCDCCRPDHLFISTIQGNNMDMKLKGRRSPAPHRKLSDDQVREIRKAHANGESIRSIGRRIYGGDHNSARNLVRCRSFSWVK